MRPRRGSFRIDATQLAGGTAAAQVISIVALPVLTRLYSPADFGILVIVQSAAAVAAIFATGRYEYAVVSAKKHSEAWASVWLILLLSASALIVTLILGTSYLAVFDSAEPQVDRVAIIYLSSLLIGVTGSYQGLYFWANRNGKFARMSVNGIIGAVAVATISIALGIVEFGAVGLLIGNVAGQLTNTSLLAWQTLSERGGLRFPGFHRILATARAQKELPKYLVPSGLLERMSAQMHVFVLSAIFGTSVAGSLGLYRKVVSVPSRLVGNSVRQVFRQRAAKQWNANGECRVLFDRATRDLAYIGLPISVAMIVFAPYLFTFVFGEEWSEAGRYAQLLAPMFLFRFVTSPVSSLIIVANRPKYELTFQALLAVLSLTLLLVGNAVGGLYLAVFGFGLAHCIKAAIVFFVAKRIAHGTM